MARTPTLAANNGPLRGATAFAQAVQPVLVTGVAWFALGILALLFLHNVRSSTFIDFEAYYAAASAVRDGGRLYERALVWRDTEYTIDRPGLPQPTEGLPYVYPPPVALAFLPVTLVPFKAASVAWLALNYGVLLIASFVLIRLIFPGRPRDQIAAISLGTILAVFQPIRGSLFWGQVDIVLLLLLALSLASFTARRDSLAGFWLGLALVIKPFLAIMLLFYLWKGALRVVAMACTFAGGLFGASLLIVGPDTLLDFIAALRYWSSPSFAVNPGNQSPYGFLLRLLTVNPYTVPIVEAPALVGPARAMLGLAMVVAVVVLVSRSRTATTGQMAIEYGLFVVAMLLVSPLAQTGHYTYLVIPMLAVVARALAPGRSRQSQVALLVAVGAILAYLSLPGLQGWAFALYTYYQAPVSAPRLLMTGVHLYALCALTVVILTEVGLQRRTTLARR